jgi:hypothetical protein
MTRRSRIWLVVAALFSLINVAGAVFAAARREWLHAGTHIGLALLGAYAVWWLAPSRTARRRWPRREAVSPGTPGELSDRLTHLEHAVDAIAIEVERIGEGQRFITRSFVEHASPQEPDEGAAEPSESTIREAAPRERQD